MPLAERFGCSLIMAVRPWEVKVFDELRREPNLERFQARETSRGLRYPPA